MCIEMVLVETIRAWGHPNIVAKHRTTLEITREEHLTIRGDCIIGVRADKSVKDLDPLFRENVKRDDTVLVIVLEAKGYRDIVLAHGSKKLLLTSDKKIIIRKSTYVEPATLAIKANKSAIDINRELIHALKNPDTELRVTLYLITLQELSRSSTNIFE